MTSTVSVVIPAFNRSKTISRCLDSIRQAASQWPEVIVVDDGSSDDTCSVVSDFSRDMGLPVKLIRQANRGAAAARNAGMQAATGCYLQFLDSDDALLASKIDASVELLERDGSVVCVYTDMLVECGYGVPERVEAVHEHVRRLADRNSPVFTCGMNTNMPLWRTQFLRSRPYGWNEALRAWDEAEYYGRLFMDADNSAAISHISLDGVRFSRLEGIATISGAEKTAPYIICQLSAIDSLMAHAEKQGMSMEPLHFQYKNYLRILFRRAVVGRADVAAKEIGKRVAAAAIKERWVLLTKLPFWLVSMGYSMKRAISGS